MAITLQLSMRITLSVFMFVAAILPVAPNGGHDKSKPDIESLANNVSDFAFSNNSNISKTSSKLTDTKFVLSNEPSGEESNATDVPESAIKPVVANSRVTNESLTVTDKNVSVNVKRKQNVEPGKDNVINAEPTNAMNPSANVNNENHTSSEQADLLESHVTPHDDDDDEVLATTKYIVLKEISAIPNAVEHEDSGTTTSTISETTVTPLSGDQIHITNNPIEALHNDKTNVTSQTELTETTSILIQQAQTVQLASKTNPEKSGEDGMPASIIALITAITFAVALAIAYVSMIAWRRYLEYRYGHRELLVNDLEFDTNDLRHFEL